MDHIDISIRTEHGTIGRIVSPDDSVLEIKWDIQENGKSMWPKPLDLLNLQSIHTSKSTNAVIQRSTT